MTSGDEAQLRQAFVLPDGQPLDPALAPGLAGLTVTIDPATYQPTGADTATAEAVVTDAAGATSTWDLELMLTDTGWQIIDTVAQEAP